MSPLVVRTSSVLSAISRPVMPRAASMVSTSATTSTSVSTKVSSTRPAVEVRNTSPWELKLVLATTAPAEFSTTGACEASAA